MESLKENQDNFIGLPSNYVKRKCKFISSQKLFQTKVFPLDIFIDNANSMRRVLSLRSLPF